MRRTHAVVHVPVGAAIFVVALVLGALLHLRIVPMFRRLVVASVNATLEPLFLGHLHIDGVTRIGFNGVLALDAHLDDAQGRRLVTLEGVDVRFSTLTLLWSLPRAPAPIDVDVPDVTVARSYVDLEPDDAGVPRIAGAFDARAPTPSTGPGRPVRLALPHVHIGHTSIRAPPIDDAEVDGADVSLLLSDGLEVELDRGRLTVRGLPRDAQASGLVQAYFEQPASGARVIRASWDGAVGAVLERAEMVLRGEDLDASLDVSPVGSAEVCALLPQWPIARVCAAHAEAHGTLARLALALHASVGGGTVDVSGPVTLEPPLQATLQVDVRGFDGAALVSPIPCSDIDFGGDVWVAVRSPGDVDGRASVALTRGQCAANRLPPATISTDFARTARGDVAGHADIAIQEPGAPTVLSLRLETGAEGPALSFEGEASSANLEQVRGLGRTIGGSGTAHASGTIDLRTLSLDGRASASFSDLRAHDVAVSDARVEGRVSGRLLAPSFDVEVEAGSVEAPAVKLSAISARARMTVDSGVAFHDVQVDFAGEGPPVRASAALVSIREGSLELDGGLLEGLGAPLTAEVRGSSAAVTVRAKTAGIDLERVASFAALPVRKGTLSLNLDTTVISNSAEGRVELDLAHGVVGTLKNASAHLEAVLHGRQGHGRATATVDDIGTIEAHSTSLTVGKGGLLTSTPWRNAWGALDVNARADLAKLAARFPAVVASTGNVEGQLELAVRVARDSQEDITPEVDVTVRTTGLVVNRKGSPGGWRLDGVDPVVHVLVNGDTGKTAVDAQLDDAHGVLATLKATSSSVPYSAIFSAEGVTEALLSTPFTAALEVPQRSLASLPVGLGQSGRRGDLTARVDWRGPFANPNVSFTGELVRGRADPNLVALPVDLSVTGQYQGARLDVHMRGSQRGVAVAEATAMVSVNARDWIDRGAQAAWAASGRANLERFPLRSIDVLDDRQVRGTVSGEITLDRLHDDANASAKLDFDSLQVGDVACKSAQLTAKVDGHDLQSEVSVELTPGGSIVAQLSAGTHWGAALLPGIDTAQLATASLKANQFRAEMLLPWLPGVTELGGRIDADASAELDVQHQVVRPRGTLRLSEGTLELGWMGTEFHGISGNAVLTPDGIIRLQDVIAHGTTGTLRAALTARILGTTLGGANATVQIPRSDPLPLVVGGAKLGKVDGRFDLTMKRSSHQNDIEVNVPSMTVDLSAASTNRDVQDLGEVAGVRVGRVSSSEFILEPLDATTDDSAEPGTRKPGGPVATSTVIDVRLGQDVEVRKGTDLDVRLEGNPKVTIGPGVRVSGQIRLVRGTLDVQGKPFEIEKGTVAFVEADPANPQVVLSAGWTAPDGTRVYASFVGPLKTGKVTLRSEPARPQNEILALILFGTTDQSSGANPQSNSVAAAAGGVATQPLNHALGGVNQALDKMGLAGGISTKVDTSTPNPRPEVQVQIARDISLQVAWVLGSPPPGTNPDTTLVTLDWRFLRKWALETTVGDAGTSIVDVVWQHRY